jgi:hypothetical protein
MTVEQVMSVNQLPTKPAAYGRGVGSKYGPKTLGDDSRVTFFFKCQS